MFLATTAIEEYWDIDQEILFLGEWCKVYPRKIFHSTLNYSTLAFIWNDEDKLRNAWDYCEVEYQNFLSLLIPILNKYHNLNATRKYWDILLKPWLSIYIQTMYDKYQHIQFANEKYDVESIILSEKNYQIINEPNTFMSNIRDNDEYNLQLYSQIIKFLEIKHTEKEYRIQKLSSKIEYKSSNWRMKVKRISKSLHKKHHHEKSLMIVNPYFKFDFWKNLKKLARKTNMQYFFDDLQYDLSIDGQFDKGLRSELFNIQTVDNEFQKLILETFIFNFPLIYLEEFTAFRAKVFELDIKIPTAIYSANSIFNNEIYKFFIAENYQKIRILYAQHGGVIGINTNMNAESLERNMADIYYTFGWQETSKTIPLSMPTYTKKFEHNKKNVNFIMNSMPRYLCGFSFTADSSKMLKYIDTVEVFFQNCKLSEEMIIRPYMIEYGWHIEERLLSINKNLHFDNSSNYYEQISTAKLNIFDHMYTGYLESLSLNIPTIIIIDKETYHFRESFLPFLNKLVEQNILFFDPKEASTFIDCTIVDIDNWWNNLELQNVVKDFCYNYSRSSTKWDENWIKELNKSL